MGVTDIHTGVVNVAIISTRCESFIGLQSVCPDCKGLTVADKTGKF